MRVFARAATPLAAVLLIALALADTGDSEAHHLCSATGSPFGPFDIETYEAADYRGLYGQTLELAGANELFPEINSFAVPQLNAGARGTNSKAAPYIPPVLLKSIASIESSWAQADYSVPYGGVGAVLSSHDCGYGIMQVTSGMQNIAGAPNLDQAMIGGHFAFNIARGAHILADKWNLAPNLRPIVGNADPKVIENWYFALWGYNGFAFQNHPLNPSFSPQRVDFSCGPSNDGFGHDRTQYPYQELVMGCAQHPPERSGELLWEPQEVHLPELTNPAFADPLDPSNWTACSQSANCASMDIPTPNTNHQDQTEIAAEREDVIGSPKTQVVPAKVDLVSIPGVSQGKTTVTVSNSGTGVLAFRVNVTAPWIKVSRTQGIALGSDLGVRKSSFTVETNTSGLAPGTYKGDVVIESLYAEGTQTKIPVTIAHFADGTLLAGSGPKVYVMRSGLKRWIPNRETFEANGFRWDKIGKVPDTVLNSVQNGNPLPNVLATGNLISGGGPQVYVMDSGTKRHVTSRNAMNACGYAFSDIRPLPGTRVEALPNGDPLLGAPCPRLSPPDGSLLQGQGPAIYVARGSLKRHIPDPATFEGLAFHRGNVDRIGNSLLAGVQAGNTLPSVLDTGTLLKSASGNVYVMSNGSKRLINGSTVMAACGYSSSAAHTLSQARLDTIPDTVPLVAAPCPRLSPGDGRLLKANNSTAVYMMRSGLRRHIPDPATLDANGFLAGDIDTYHHSLVAAIPEGAPLLSVLADGNIIKGSGNALYVMHLGVRRPVNLGVMNDCGYGVDAIKLLPDARIGQIASGAPLSGPPCVAPSIAAGALITGTGPEVYVMQNGQKRHVSSGVVFGACGYKWGNVDKVADSLLALIPTGTSLNGPPCP